MLSPDEVKPFLCHEEKRIREHAVDYFAKSHSKDEDLMPLIIESCIKFGEEDNSLLLAKASNFVQSEESLETITKWLEKSNNTNILFHYNSIIATASIDTLEPCLPRLKRGKNVFRETIDRINRRFSLSTYDTNTLCEKLFDYCKEGEGKKVNEFNYTLEVIDELRNTFLKEEWQFKIFAASVLIKLPSSEEALLGRAGFERQRGRKTSFHHQDLWIKIFTKLNPLKVELKFLHPSS